jgi:DNA repair exonuclease SbcCD ATPase subunit
MIHFEKLRYKNFLSTGNNFTEIDFEKTPTTLVVGQNGAGKSTMLDAISFGLFGKPHRKISKMQLVNSINEKGTVVEVEFRIGKKQFKIVRTIKPNKFEVWIDGNMSNQNSHVTDYQAMLEKNILKLNHKSFHQIVVLGSSSFIPFMQLSSQQRRGVIEDLLDINMFSIMNQLLKEKVSILKEKITQNENDINLVDSKINAQKKYLRDIASVNAQFRKEKEQTIQETQRDIKVLNEKNEKLSKQVEKNLEPTIQNLDNVQLKRDKLSKLITSIETQCKACKKEHKFFKDNDECPTCSQEIDLKLKQEKIETTKKRLGELDEGIAKGKDELANINATIEIFNKTVADCREWNAEISGNTKTIGKLNKVIDSLQNEIESQIESSGDLSDANAELEEYRKEKEKHQDEKYKLNEQFSYHQVSGELLRDTGIKSKIIKQYLPVINKLTNQYLQTLDFFVHFDLDESFVETIRSRHRDAFTYDSFSEGEKQRIDLSLLFTWRQIAKMKNSVATNLLVLDETFDSSLDMEGVDNLMKILYTLQEDTKVFVISHKGELEDSIFDRKIEFIKDKNFSKIK